MMRNLPKKSRKPEPVWSDTPIQFWRQLDAYGDHRLTRTPYFYRRLAISFLQSSRSFEWIKGSRATHLSLAKTYLHLYREAIAKWSQQFGVTIDQGGASA